MAHSIRSSISALSILFFLEGCYFAHGETFEQQALVRVKTGEPSTYSYEIRGTWWHTGNAHMPFDFTVYEYPNIYEIRTHRKTGTIDADDIELLRCGQKVANLSGNIKVSDNEIQIALEYPTLSGKVEKVQANLNIIAGIGPQQTCK